MNLVRELRSTRDAPVDYVGTERLGDPTQPRKIWAYQTLVAVMLSSQTKDVTTAVAMDALKKHGLTVDNIDKNTTVAKLNALIKKVGFHNVKAKNIKAATRILLEEHEGCVPESAASLLELPGVGPKMAHLVVNALTGKPEGIAIDTHVHRMANQLGWVETKTPEQTRIGIESWLPFEEWPTLNLLLVGVGQQTQTEKTKILQRCLSVSDPIAALRLMVTLGLPLTYRDKETKETVLFWAARQGNHAVLRWLKKAEKSEVLQIPAVTTKNADGQTAVDVAKDTLTAKLLQRYSET